MALDTMSIDGQWIKDNETKEFNEIIYDDDKVSVNDVMNSVDVPDTSFDEEVDVNKIMDSVDVPEIEFEDEKDIFYYKNKFNEIYKNNVNLESIINDSNLIDSNYKVISSEDMDKKQEVSGTLKIDNINELISFTNALNQKYGKSNYNMWTDIEKEKYIQLYCKVYNVGREHAINAISGTSNNKVSEVYVGKNRNTILEQIYNAKTMLSDIYSRYNELSYEDQQLFLELYSKCDKVKYMNVTNTEMEQQQLDEALNVTVEISKLNERLHSKKI